MIIKTNAYFSHICNAHNYTYFLMCRHLLELGRENGMYHIITNCAIIFCIPCLFKSTLLWYTHHAIMNFPNHNTHFQHGNSSCDGRYAHIFAMSISGAVWYIWRPCFITEFLYVSKIWLLIYPDLLFCEFRLCFLIYLDNNTTMIIKTNA